MAPCHGGPAREPIPASVPWSKGGGRSPTLAQMVQVTTARESMSQTQNRASTGRTVLMRMKNTSLGCPYCVLYCRAVLSAGKRHVCLHVCDELGAARVSLLLSSSRFSC